ncbi:MAG: hypothetical protein A2293_09695 [Elusimicrobia bacterium RIFOXYB2_FULL_49_7]|nr:MAG: hypothetical protein A2293_09695 [Elusimicrobia bacterium RIFOXYB2_FULL_49_7]
MQKNIPPNGFIIYFYIMLYFMLGTVFVALFILFLTISLQVNAFVKRMDEFIKQVESHIYL